MDYNSKYRKPLPSDLETIYAKQPSQTDRQKRFLGALVKGISNLFKGGNLFGSIIKGIKTIGGYVFKGINGLLHRHKNSALMQAMNLFKSHTSKLKVGKLFHLHSFKGLHMVKSTFYNHLKSRFMKIKTFTETEFSHRFGDLTHRFAEHRVNALMHFMQYHQETLHHLHEQVHMFQRLIDGIDQLSSGRLSTAIISPQKLHALLAKVVKDVMSKHPQFTPLYIYLYHYFEANLVSFTNDDKMIFIQIPIFFVNKHQEVLPLFRIHSTHVPLDKDTYDGKEHKYTKANLEHQYLAISSHEFVDLADLTLQSCNRYDMDYLCEMIHVTSARTKLSCAAALYADTVEHSMPLDSLKDVIRDTCNFTYYEHKIPSPTTLQTQDEILLAHFPSSGWQLVCDTLSDRPLQMDGTIYAVVSRDDLCTCGILADNLFLYESMRTCEKPDTKLTLYYTYNRALVNYDKSINAKASKAYGKRPYDFIAPDIQYELKELLLNENFTVSSRTKRHAPDPINFNEDIAKISMPLDTAVNFMESQKPYSFSSSAIPPQLQCSCPRDPSQQLPFSSHDTEMVFSSTTANTIFNVVTIVNSLLHCTLFILSKCAICEGGWIHNLIIHTVQTVITHSQSVKAVHLLDVPTTDLIDISSDNLPPPPSDWEPSTLTVSPTSLAVLTAPHVSLILKIILIILSTILFFLLMYLLFRLFFYPLSRKSALLRQFCSSCYSTPSQNLTSSTDLFLDIVHIYSGQQIRIYLTTIAAPACSLGFIGTVKLKNFRLTLGHFKIVVHIDWHNCLLLYNEFVIPLPDMGTAFLFQPNLLTDFDHPGPYNIVLLARHMDTLIPIPHISQQDFLSAEDRLQFAPLTTPDQNTPYSQVHQEVKAMMPLANSVASTDTSSHIIDPAAPNCSHSV